MRPIVHSDIPPANWAKRQIESKLAHAFEGLPGGPWRVAVWPAGPAPGADLVVRAQGEVGAVYGWIGNGEPLDSALARLTRSVLAVERDELERRGMIPAHN